MTLVSLHRDTPRSFGRGGVAPLARAVRKLRSGLQKIHAAIAAARLRRLRNELMLSGRAGVRPRLRQPQLPAVLGEKWDF